MPNPAVIELEVFCSVCSSQLNVSSVKDNYIMVDNCRQCRNDKFKDGVDRGFEKFTEEVKKKEEKEAVEEVVEEVKKEEVKDKGGSTGDKDTPVEDNESSGSVG